MLLDLITFDRQSDVPLFEQLSFQLIGMIKDGTLKAGYQLPGSRVMASTFQIHRKTVVAAIDELTTQGWLSTVPGKGTYVQENIELSTVQPLADFKSTEHFAEAPRLKAPLTRGLSLATQRLHLDDGLPDPRLAPVKELARAYKSSLTQGNLYTKYGYSDTKGSSRLRQILAEYLNKTRGMQVGVEQILITRGVTQALYLCIQGFLSSGDQVAVGELNWESANANFIYHGVKPVKIKVDAEGLDTDHLEEVLQSSQIKMLYLTPHHQYPTTVIMPAHRRLKVIQLARQYGVYVFEDDYDYDFHFANRPIMPLASAEHGDFVLYTGSFTKAISPVFRVGYLVASEAQIDYLSRIRRMVDRQGDTLLELAIAELLDLGILQRSLRKNRRIYQQRRDFFCELLTDQLGNYLNFELPAGGMSVWTHFEPSVNLSLLARRAAKQDLYIQPPSHSDEEGNLLNAIRMGYASSTFEELEQSVGILNALLK